jgi:hypothetical protein
MQGKRLSSRVLPKETVMSRSHRKFSSQPTSEFEPVDWGGIRAKERRCVFDEMSASEKGDVIFPRYYASGNGSWSFSSRYYYPEYEIRDGYATEIRNILNGYCDDRKDFEASFLERYAQIRNCDSDSLPSCFEWLDTREAKAAIKGWKGEPLEALSYLNHRRIIEKAVKLEKRRMARK